MHLGNISSGASFKAALLFVAVFLTVMASTGWVVASMLRVSLIEELEAEISADTNFLVQTYKQGGYATLVNVVHQMAKAPVHSERVVALFSPSGERLAGLDIAQPDFIGWGALAPSDIKGMNNSKYRVYVTSHNDIVIVVGQSTELIQAAQDSLLVTLITAGLFVTGMTPLVGYAISRRVFRRLETIAQTLEKVSQGNTAIRLPVQSSNDQIDRISRQINRHLEQLSMLMENTRNTATAIAHDLRTPLGRAHLLVQEAERDCESCHGERSMRQSLEEALEELEAVTTIFDTVLRISKIGTSTDESNFATINIAELVEDIACIYRPVLENTDQTLTLDGEGGRQTAILGDRRMLRQMLVNLVENASHYCPSGSDIKLIANCTDKNTATIVVSDNGPGIPAERREDVLKPFFRGDPSRTDSGTGLGLALVNAIVMRHGGEIELGDNNPGLRVIVRLPVVCIT